MGLEFLNERVDVLVARAFGESDFSRDFLRQYELEWRKTKFSHSIQFQYVKSRISLAMSSLHLESYIRMQGAYTRIIRSKLGKLFVNRT